MDLNSCEINEDSLRIRIAIGIIALSFGPILINIFNPNEFISALSAIIIGLDFFLAIYVTLIALAYLPFGYGKFKEIYRPTANIFFTVGFLGQLSTLVAYVLLYAINQEFTKYILNTTLFEFGIRAPLFVVPMGVVMVLFFLLPRLLRKPGETLNLFVDCSGDIGFGKGSRWFTAGILESYNLKHITNSFEDLKQQLTQNNSKWKKKEIKSTNLGRQMKLALNILKTSKANLFVGSLDTHNIPKSLISNKPPAFFEDSGIPINTMGLEVRVPAFIIWSIIKMHYAFNGELRKVNVVYDEKFETNIWQVREVNLHLERQCKSKGIAYTVKYVKSEKSYGVKLADIIAGAYWKLLEKSDRNFNSIAERVNIGRVYFKGNQTLFRFENFVFKTTF